MYNFFCGKEQYSIMSNQFTREDRIELHGQRDRLKQIVDIKWSTLSEHAELNVRTITSRKVRSDIQIGSSGNYDDLCGPWIYPKNPLYNQYVDPPHPSLCIWKYFTKEDIIYLKEYQENKNVIRSFFANKSLNKMARKDQTVLTNVLWEFFKFTRLNLFTEKSISACLGIAYLTHLFFISYPWWTAEEIHKFFYETILLHVTLDPPKSLEVFSVIQCELLFKLFRKVYIENLVLLHLLCHPSYRFTLKLCNSEKYATKDCQNIRRQVNYVPNVHLYFKIDSFV